MLSEAEETKRLDQFEKIARNWDRLPSKAQGKLEGSIEMVAAICLDNPTKEGEGGDSACQK